MAGRALLVLVPLLIGSEAARLVTVGAKGCAPLNATYLLTSTPSRQGRLPRVLQTLRQQTLLPQRVVLTAARRYDAARFGNASMTLPPEVLRSQRPRVRVHELRTDRGPISKYLGALSLADPRSVVVVGDDDVFYGRTMLEDFACAVASGPERTVFSSGIDRDCGALAPCVMGFRGVALRAGMLRGLEAWEPPRPCFLADDVAITFFLTRVRGYRIRRLRLRSKHKLDDAFAWSNSSIHSFHHAHKHRVNGRCADALLARGEQRERACGGPCGTN